MPLPTPPSLITMTLYVSVKCTHTRAQGAGWARVAQYWAHHSESVSLPAPSAHSPLSPRVHTRISPDLPPSLPLTYQSCCCLWAPVGQCLPSIPCSDSCFQPPISWRLFLSAREDRPSWGDRPSPSNSTTPVLTSPGLMSLLLPQTGLSLPPAPSLCS